MCEATVDALTAREIEVVELVVSGRSTIEIAGELTISPRTVEAHIRAASKKTGTHTRVQLVVRLLALGLVGLPADDEIGCRCHIEPATGLRRG